MSANKLEALLALASNEGATIDEQRNAAREYVRLGGRMVAAKPTASRPPTDDEIKAACTPERIRSVFRTDFEDLKREQKEALSKATAERDAALRERDALKRQLSELRAHGKALLAFVPTQWTDKELAQHDAEKAIDEANWLAQANASDGEDDGKDISFDRPAPNHNPETCRDPACECMPF